MWPVDRPPRWVDRSQELAALRAGVKALRDGGGAAIWVEGEPGIGKSSLVVEALTEAGGRGWNICWGMADQLAERLPLSVIQDCLQVRLGSPDPRRAHAAGLLRSQRLGLFADGDASVASVEVLMALADELCAAAPTVMVIDDLQWADDASLLVWHQLAASIDQLRLLLIATCRSDPHRPEVQQMRAAQARRGGAVVTLGPLSETHVAALATELLGTLPADALRQLTAQVAGNPPVPARAGRRPGAGAGAGKSRRRRLHGPGTTAGAARPLVRRELGPSRAGLDGSGNGAVGRWAVKGATMSSGEAGTPHVLAAAPTGGGVVSRCALFGRLAGAERVVYMSAPAGSGKTVLLRSWVGAAGLTERAAWVSAGRQERDPQRFWLSVLSALRETAPGSALVRPLTAAPDVDGGAIVERLLADLASLAGRVWLVVDDVHELGPDALRQLELLIMRAPLGLRFVLATRHDVRLGLYRLRLDGDLTEIREPDLRFTVAEARQLFAAAGARLPEAAVVLLHERTEGWAAGLRLAALSLAGHPDPERFAAGFSGTDRTVAEYLLNEVLDRQRDQVRRLLLRTCILDRVNGELADLLTGDKGGERVLQDLERANAFVVSLDVSRSWFRYHQMFAGLLRLELRRTAPDEVAALHRAAAGWFAGHGYPVEAIRHAQAAQDWGPAARLLADHWLDLYLDGRGAILVELLTRFPRRVVAASPELTAVQVAGDLVGGSLEDAGRHLAVATGAVAAVPADRRGRVQVMLAVLRLFLARRLVDIAAVAEEAQRLLALTEGSDAAQLGLGEDLRAAAFISLGIAEIWALKFQDAERHLQQGIALAHGIGRPYLELHGLAHWAHGMLLFRPDVLQAEQSRQAIELAERHGWSEEPLGGVAYTHLGIVLLYQGRLEEAEPWLQRAERTLRTEVEPAAGMSLRHARAVLELARGNYQEALTAFRGAEKPAAALVTPHTSVTLMRSHMLQTLVRLGQTGRAEQALAVLGEDERASAEMRTAAAALRLAAGDPQAAADALAPVLDGSVSGVCQVRMVTALLLEATARDALGDQITAGRALERALDITGSNGILLPFLLYPAPALLGRHRQYPTANSSAHPALVSQILDLLAGNRSAPPDSQAGWTRGRGLDEQLTEREIRVLRYLPTHLTTHEMANEMFVSENTVSTHRRHLYAKLGVHSRNEAVERARALGLLAPSARRLMAESPS